MESHCIRPSQFEPNQIVDNKLMERFQQEGGAAQRCSIQFLSLLVAQCLLDDPNAELWGLRVHFVFLVIQISEKPFYCFNSLQAIFRQSRMLSAYSRTAGQFLAFESLECGGKATHPLFLRGITRHLFVTARSQSQFPPVRQGGFVEVIPQYEQGILRKVSCTTFVSVLSDRFTACINVLLIHRVALF